MSQVETPIVPVIDLMIGQVVLAVAGNRDSYLPVHSKLTRSSDPLDVAKAIYGQTGCTEFYMADIDTFAGAAPNWTAYQRIADQGFQLWVDADWSGSRADQLIALAETLGCDGCITPIVSSETLQQRSDLERLEKLRASGLSPIFSIDLRAGELISKGATSAESDLKGTTVTDLAEMAIQRGVEHLILIDVASVGSESGPSHLDLIREIRNYAPDVELTSGGGIRTAEDAQAMLAAGCQHVLVASAIHACQFTPDDVTGLFKTSAT